MLNSFKDFFGRWGLEWILLVIFYLDYIACVAKMDLLCYINKDYMYLSIDIKPDMFIHQITLFCHDIYPSYLAI